jgi:hypothetical protein
VLAAGVVALLTFQPSSAVAGGWAVSSLDPLSEPLVAGRDVSVGLTILQHGITPAQLDNVAIVIEGSSGTERFVAEPEGPVGHYVAVVRFPSAGEYRWTLEPGWFAPQPLGKVTVGGRAVVATSQPDRRGSVPVRFGTGLATATAAACTILYAFRSTRSARSQKAGQALGVA